MYFLKFATSCTAVDEFKKEVSCADSNGFRAKRLVGLVAGDKETNGTKIVLNIEITVPVDDKKLYKDAEALIQLEAKGFDPAQKDSLEVYDNNQAICKEHPNCLFILSNIV